MQTELTNNDEIIQGSDQWLELRRTKITASDAAVIMGLSPWKNKIQLYYDKKNKIESNKTSAMQRGIDLEPIARDLYEIKTGIEVIPKVILKDWAMASLDGMSVCGNHIVEIKCPGKKDHDLALQGKIPEYYYPQLQHQMYVCNLSTVDYFSFDGFDGVIVNIKRDHEFIARMIIAELEFYECLMNCIEP